MISIKFIELSFLNHKIGLFLKITTLISLKVSWKVILGNNYFILWSRGNWAVSIKIDVGLLKKSSIAQFFHFYKGIQRISKNKVKYEPNAILISKASFEVLKCIYIFSFMIKFNSATTFNIAKKVWKSNIWQLGKLLLQRLWTKTTKKIS